MDHIVEGWNSVVDGVGSEAETKDSVEFKVAERSIQCLGECLLFNVQTTNL